MDSAVENCANKSGNVWAYLQCMRGDQQQPLGIAIPLTVVNVLIFVSGLLGNIAVCVVIIKHKSLHTATNYYLFNLAVSDLTLLIFVAHAPALIGLESKLLASYVSVLTIVAFSTERYLAICHPLYLHTMSGLQRAIRIITCLWVLAFCSALPFSFYTGVDYLHYPPNSTNVTDILEESAFCAMLSQPEVVPLTETSTIVFFILPMLTIVVQYTKMGMEISKTTKRTLCKGLKGSVHRDSRRTQTNKSVIRMLTAVVVAFFLCWAPFHIQRLFSQYSSEFISSEISTWMFLTTGILYYFSSTLNPILYNVMSDRMRNAFKEVFCKRCSKVKTRRKKIKRGSTGKEITWSRSFNLRSIDRSSSGRGGETCASVVNRSEDDTLTLIVNTEMRYCNNKEEVCKSETFV